MNTAGRRSRRPLVLALSVAGLALVAALAWYANRPASVAPAGKPGGGAAAAAPAPVAVEVHTVAAQALPDAVSAVGTLVSNESVVLRPEVAGRIAAIHFGDGAAVRQGELLVEFDAAVQLAEVQQARANLALAEASARRAEDLFARKFVSQSALDAARSQLEVARAGAALAQARLERMRLRAPFAGVVGIRDVSPGDYVKDGEALINLEDIATLKVDFRLPEQYLGRIARGQVVRLTSDVLAGEVFDAVVSAVDPLVDAQGRALRLRATLANPQHRLRPGMFARVRLVLAERPAVLVVPETALVPAPGNVQFVYRVVGDKAQRVNVSVGVRADAMVEISAGLAAGDVVVTAGQLKLREGAPLKVVPPPQGKPAAAG